MKKIILSSLLAISVSAVGFAAPITDYSTEKLGIDTTYQPKLHFGCDADIDGNTKTLDYGITVALNNNWGVQYVQNNFKTDTTRAINSYGSYEADANLKVNQFNLTYNSSKNKILFLGITKHKVDIFADAAFTSGHTIQVSGSSKNVTGIQFGMIEVIPITENLSSYGIMSIGTQLFNIEMGLSQQVSKNVDLNLFYKYTKCTDIGDTDIDVSTNGIGFGFSYKF